MGEKAGAGLESAETQMGHTHRQWDGSEAGGQSLNIHMMFG